MLILNANEVRQALPMHQTIAAMKNAYAALSTGKAEVPLRTRLPVTPHDGVTLFMPAFVDEAEGQSLAVKIVSIFNQNPAKGLPLIHAAVMVMDAETGKMLAVLEGGALTAIRTGAGCAAAADILARPAASTLAIFGAGVQARTQLEAMCTIREIETAWVYSPDIPGVQAFIAEMAGKGPIPQDLRAATDPQQAVQNADIIAAATTSNTPVFDFAHVKPGTHISGAGSYLPTMQEIPAAAVTAAVVVVDSKSAVLEESGDLITPIQSGQITPDHIHAEIGQIIAGQKSGRENETQTTFFKSVGIAVQDAAAGQLALKNAISQTLGTQINW